MQIRVTPSGIMDKDTDPAYVNQGNYIDANDIRHRQTDGSTFGGVMSVIGNTNVLTFPDYTTSSKKYRIYIDISKVQDGSVAANEGYIILKTSTGSVFTSILHSISPPMPVVPGVTLVNYVAILQGYFNILSNSAYGGLLTYTNYTETSSVEAYFDITTSLDTDLVLTINNITAELCTIKLVNEYIATSGSFKVIGSQQLQDYLFVWLAGTGVSEIGVVYSTDNDVTFNYVRLLRSRRLNFSVDRRVEAEIERNGDEVNLYWTDGFNKPRAMYLKYSLITTTDAFLFTSGGQYELETIEEESAFFSRVPQAYFTNIEVKETGGFLTSGNKRYTGRFLTEDLTPTDFLYPTNIINIYNKKITTPSEIRGEQDSTSTNKYVSMTIENITPDLYTYFELVAIEYKDAAFSAVIVQRFKLASNQTSIDVEHTNLGQENIILSNNELVAITSKYLTSQSLKVFDNRITLSNLTETVDLNLTAWAQTIRHSIEQGYIEGIGKSFEQNQNLVNSFTDHKYGEYLVPNNTFDYTSYMYNDTYRFGIQVQWKEYNKWSLPYWIDDIRIDRSATNVIGNRRDASVSGVDINLQDTSNNRVKYYYVNFNNINLDAVVGGRRIRDLITGFRIVRSKRIPEVLATGIFYAGVEHSDGRFTTTFPIVPFLGIQNGTTLGVANPLMRNNAGYIFGTAQNLAIGTSSTTSLVSVCGGTGATDYSDYLFFYSPDFYFNNADYQFNASTDKVRLAAAPYEHAIFSGHSRANQRHANGSNNSSYQDYGGYFGATTQNYTDFLATHHTHLETGSNTSLNTKTVSAAYAWQTLYSNLASSEVFKISSKAHSNTGLADNGMWYGQIFRDLGGNKKYPANKELSFYESTGHYYLLTPGQSGPINNVSVYGGDTFIQKSHMAIHRMPHNDLLWGMGYGISFYSQNSGNYQMFNILDHDDSFSGPGYVFPQYLDKNSTGNYWVDYLGSPVLTALPDGSIGSGLFYWLEQWPEVSNQNNYSRSYNYKDDTIIETNYNSNVKYDGSLPSRVTWSAKKVIGSQKDNYRTFKPLDFVDLDLTFGPIVHHDIINNSFYTWQPFSVQRQYFRDASLLGSQEGSDVVVGSGSILGAPGQELTAIGMFNKWAHVKGKNTTGKDTFYWYNDQSQKLVRFGQDGTRVISDKGLISYLTNNGKFGLNDKYPLTGKGISGVWNDKYGEAIFTFKYTEGVTNKQFTLVYDELKNGFICFHSYYPNIYLRYKNTFFSPNPAVGLTKTLYLHDRGSESTYYGTYYPATITAVMNYEPNVSKNFEALQFVTDKQPFDVYLTTPTHISYLDETEFEKREDLWYSPIKNDSTISGLNNGDTSRLWGKWLKVKISLESSSAKQKLINFIVKFRTMARLYNQ
jgi:hypothetical protein